MSDLRPNPNYILVELIEDSTEQGGFVLPETIKDKPAKGKVLALGGAEEVKFKVGDTIVFKRWSSNSLDLKDRDLDVKLIHYDDVLGYYG